MLVLQNDKFLNCQNDNEIKMTKRNEKSTYDKKDNGILCQIIDEKSSL